MNGILTASERLAIKKAIVAIESATDRNGWETMVDTFGLRPYDTLDMLELILDTDTIWNR